MLRLTPFLRPLPLALALQAVIAGQAVAAGFNIAPGSTENSAQTLSAGTANIGAGASLIVDGKDAAIGIVDKTEFAAVIDNAGTIRQTGEGRAIDLDAGTPALTIHNRQGALIEATDNVAIRFNKKGTVYILDNQGTILQSGKSIDGERAIKADDEYESVGNQIINGSASNREALIHSNGDDALRLGNNFTLINYGEISSSGQVNTSCPSDMKCDDDFSAADGVAIENERGNVAILNHGTIIGPRHGITGGDPLAADADSNLLGLERLVIHAADGEGVTFDRTGVDGSVIENVKIANPLVINYEDGQIIGKNGSGVGFDGHGVVFNYGLISGNYAGAGNIYDHEGAGETIANGDGDGVDIDGIAYVENYGRIEGTGAGGLDSGGMSNGADGIAAGGGTFINHAGGEIFGQAKGILIDDGSSGTAVASGRGTDSAHGGAARSYHAGSIIGGDDVAIGLVGDFDDVLNNYSGGVIRGGADTTRVDEADSTTAAAAVQMGGGNDSVSNAGLIEGLNGLALDLGAGDDSLTVLDGGRFIGQVDGGAGSDTLHLNGAGGRFGNSINFENLDVAAGNWSLDSDDFSGATHVQSGASLRNLRVIRGNVQVDSGASYGGGRIGGDLNLASGATLVVAGSAVQVDGSASLAGAHLRLATLPGASSDGRYNILQAGSINGEFADVDVGDLAFASARLTYGDNNVDLQLQRNGTRFADVALSGNGRSVGNALEGQTSSPLYQTLLLSNAKQAGQAMEQLAASSNASLTSVSLASGAQVGSSMRGAMQPLGGTMGNLQAALLEDNAPLLAATGVPDSARNLNDPQAQGRIWLQGLGSHGTLDGAHGGHDIRQDTQGLVLGADWGLGASWRMGVLGGYAKTDIDAGSGTSGDVDSLHLGVYAQHQSGPLALRLGTAYSWHDNRSKRSVDFAGFSDHLRGDFDANSQQAFAELGYQMGSGRLAIEPFVGLDYQRYSQESYDEKGGAAALHVEQQDHDNLSSSFGLRLAHLGTLDNGMSLTPRLSAAWRHTYGNLDSSVRQSFLSGGSAFSVEGSALDRDSLLLQTGLDLGISPGQSVGLGYSGEYGSHAQNHALLLQWQANF